MSYLTNPYMVTTVASFNLDNIKVYYKFDAVSGTTLTNYATVANNFPDGTDTTNTGTNGANVTVNESGIIDKAFEYDTSATSYTSCGDDIFIGTGDFSFNIWLFHTNENPTEACLIGGLNQDLCGYASGSDKYSAGNTPRIETTSNAPLNDWSMITYTRSSGTQTIYFNGFYEADSVNSRNIIAGSWWIGGPLPSIGENWEGRIDEFCLASGRVFTADEVEQLWNSGNALSLV